MFVTALPMVATVIVLVASPAHAKPQWDQVANIKEAGTHLGALQRTQGAKGVVKFLEACYKTHSLASEFSSALEACIAQDYIYTQALALIYGRIPPEERAKAGLPDPSQLAAAMGKRIVGTFNQYKITAADGEAFKKLVDKHGFPAFSKIAFPKSAGDPKANSPTASDEEKK